MMTTKVAEHSIVTPKRFRSYVASRHRVRTGRISVPPCLIFAFHRRMFNAVKQRIHGRYVKWYYNERLAVGALGKVPLGVLHPFIGSPAAAMMLEEMIAFGARQIIELGLCGGLVPTLRAGDIILVEEGFVDEGTSSHYFEKPRRISASRSLTKKIELVLKDAAVDHKTGGVWTTDAPYRETRSKLLRFRASGVLGVNMESSALFSVAKYREVDIASLQVVSDLVKEKGWKPSFHKNRLVEQSLLASEIAVRVLASLYESNI